MSYSLFSNIETLRHLKEGNEIGINSSGRLAVQYRPWGSILSRVATVCNYPTATDRQIQICFNRGMEKLLQLANHRAEYLYELACSSPTKSHMRELTAVSRDYDSKLEVLSSALKGLERWFEDTQICSLKAVHERTSQALKKIQELSNPQKKMFGDYFRPMFLLVENNPIDMNKWEAIPVEFILGYLADKIDLLQALDNIELSPEHHRILDHIKGDLRVLSEYHSTITGDILVGTEEGRIQHLQQHLNSRLQTLRSLSSLTSQIGIFLISGFHCWEGSEHRKIGGHSTGINIVSLKDECHDLYEANAGAGLRNPMIKGADGVVRSQTISRYGDFSTQEVWNAMWNASWPGISCYESVEQGVQNYQSAFSKFEDHRVALSDLELRPIQISGNCAIRSIWESVLSALQRVNCENLANRLLTFEIAKVRTCQAQEQFDKHPAVTDDDFLLVSTIADL